MNEIGGEERADEIVLSYRRTFEIHTVVVRPFNNVGPSQNPGSYAGIIPIVAQKIKAGDPIERCGDGEQMPSIERDLHRATARAEAGTSR